MQTTNKTFQNANKNVIWNAESLKNALGINSISPLEITSISIDSRTIEKGAAFIGIRGENFNGNLFAAMAFEKGAECCILDEIPLDAKKYSDKIILVADTFKALNDLGKFARARFQGKVIAVTGSVGKTSTKEMIKLALKDQGNIFASSGNFNNHYGLPLTLANMPIDTNYAVLELGMNNSGELTELSKIAKPHVSIITNIAAVHLENFTSVSCIAEAKAEIFNGMQEGGIAIINYDSPYEKILSNHAQNMKLKIISFSEAKTSDYKLVKYNRAFNESTITASFDNKNLVYKIGAVGKHQALNSVATIATINAIKADLNLSLNNLSNFQAHKGRGQVHIIQERKIKIIDDSYNAGPASVNAAIESISEYRQDSEGRNILILGDMKELGKDTIKFHTDLIDTIINRPIDLVHTVGNLMKNLHNLLPNNIKGLHFDQSIELAKIINLNIEENDLILIKGSQSMKMNLIVDSIINFV